MASIPPKLTLFNTTVTSSAKPKRFSEPTIEFWDRTSYTECVEIRDIVEDWFTRYPAASQAGLRSRFRDRNQQNHEGAFFELLIHELLICTGHTIIVDPSPSGTADRPDFLVTQDDGTKYFLEATTTHDRSEYEVGDDARIDQFIGAIERAEADEFSIDLQLEGKCETTPPLGAVRREVERRIQQLRSSNQPELQGAALLGAFSITHEGLRVSCRLRRTPTNTRKHFISSIGYPARAINGSKAIRESLRSKASKYRSLELPLVIALNHLHGLETQNSFTDALYGTTCIIIPRDGSKTEDETVGRRGDGFFLSNSRAIHTHVAAVLAFNSSLGRLANSTALVFTHPAPAHSISWTQLALPRFHVDSSGQRDVAGSTLAELFNGTR